jgi:hypothetical protein
MIPDNFEMIWQKAVVTYIYLTEALTRFEFFKAVTMKNAVFWYVTPCGSCKNLLCISSQPASVASYG